MQRLDSRIDERDLLIMKQYLAKTEAFAMIDGSSRFSNLQDLQNHIDILKKYKIDEFDRDGNSLLHYAVIKRNVKAVQMLIEAKADVNSINQQGKQILDDAKNNLQIFNLLIDAKADINKKDAEGNTLLRHFTVIKPNLELAHKLMVLKADIHSKDIDGNTLLHSCISYFKDDASQEAKEILKKLIEYKADTTLSNNAGLTPLTMAIKNEWYHAAQFLINNKVDVNQVDKNNIPPLKYACSGKSSDAKPEKVTRTEIVNLLLEAKANPNYQDKDQMSLLHSAAARDDSDGIISLLKHGADVNVQNKDGNTPLHMTVLADHFYSGLCDNGYFGINSYNVCKVLEYKPNIDLANKKGMTPLHIAAQRGHSYSIRDLVNAGADVKVQDDQGNSPLHYAAMHASSSDIHRLVSRGAHVNSKNSEGYTPLYYAISSQNQDAFRALLELKADPNSKAGNATPLSFAMSNLNFNTERTLEILRALIMNNADCSQKCGPMVCIMLLVITMLMI